MNEQGRVVGVATKRDEIERIRPTLLIGLGGSGREVLLRVRQRFVERYGVAGFPAVSYLWIDTDVDNAEVVEGKPKDFLSSEARLQSTECHDATIKAEEFQAYFENSHQNQHIFSWIYAGVRKSGSVLHGARQVRPLGRLAFFHHAADIRRRIVRAVSDVTDARRQDEMREQYGIEIANDALNVVLVFSVAGGTGSGMFMDTAFMLRHLAQKGEIPSVNTLGYLVLPSVFAPVTTESARLYANAYAALKELEYYSMRKDQRHDPVGAERTVADRMREVSAHDFRVNWDNGPQDQVVIGPPFNNLFLVGNAPNGGAAVPGDRKGDLFDMIAESVFVDFSRQGFAERKRSLRSNLEDYLKNDLEYRYLDDRETVSSDVFSLRFSAFGLSKLFVPVDRIRRACGYRLAVELVDRWLVRNEPRGDLRAYMVENELEALGLRVGGGRDDLRQVLDKLDDAGTTFAAAVDHDWNTERRAAMRDQAVLPKPGLKGQLAQQLNDYQRRLFLKPDDRARWGDYVRRLHLVTGPRLREGFENRLTERLHVWLAEPSVRVSLALEYLKTLHDLLDTLEDSYRKTAVSRRQRAEEHRRDWDGVLEAVEDEENGLWQHKWGMRALAEEACATAALHFENLAYAELYDVGADVVAKMKEFVGAERMVVVEGTRGEERPIRSGKVGELFGLGSQLGEIRVGLQERLSAFDRAEEHLVFTNLYREGMFKRFYRMVSPDGRQTAIDDTVRREQELVLYGELEIRSPYDLHARIRRDGMDSVRNAIEEITRTPFRHMQASSADAIELLNQLHDETAGDPSARNRVLYPEVLARTVEKGNAWLSPNRRAREGGSPLMQNYAVAVLLGIDHGQRRTERYKRFERELTEAVRRLPGLKDTEPAAVDTDPDAVFFYTELAGLPIAFIDRIENYREAYQASIQDFLHLDRHTDRFTDVALKTADEVRLAVRVTRAVLLATVLRILEVVGTGDDATLHYVDKRQFPPHRRHLGTRLDARALLSAESRLLDEVEQQIEECFRTLDPARTEQFYTLMAWHVLDGAAMGTTEVGPFAPRDVRVGDAAAVRVPMENHAVHQTLRALERRIRDRPGALPPAQREDVGRAAFERWYPRLREFCMHVQLGPDTFAIFRDDPAQPFTVDVMGGIASVFEEDHA
jgi:hypothetical protein